jgi:DNA topoisomerase-1
MFLVSINLLSVFIIIIIIMSININLFNYLLYNQFGGKSNNETKWTTFTHNGVLFPEPYVFHQIPLIYNGNKIILKPDSEEYATIYAKFTETDYVKNKTFNKNFFHDWVKILKSDGHKEITNLEQCDFSLILKHLLAHKEVKKNLSKEEKEKEKEKKDKFEAKFKEAYVDGKEQATGNFRIEPPGIFLGRGCHPKAGKIKKRVYPEDITLNIDTKSPIPELPKFLSKHKWGKIIHDNTLEWLASWKDDISGKTKYVWLGAKSDFKAKSDEHKFDMARKLAKNILEIRRTNMNNIISSDVDIKTKQLATALYLIDNLALRVGNEKGDDEADTVGVCSLRVEHINFLPDDKIELDFLGKDSVRYQNTVKIVPDVYNLMIKFTKNKKKSDDLFDLINPQMLNQYLGNMMEELTAKVFRTYNASKLFQSELNDINKQIDKMDHNDTNKINLILDMYNKANVKVAILCNHQKNISKSFNEQIDKMDERIVELKQKKKDLDKDKVLISKKDKEANKKINDKINKIKEKITEAENKKDLKMELKNLSLTTSKTNYIDPRITIAFFKKHKLPLEKIFSQTLRDKFFWAMDIPDNWTF